MKLFNVKFLILLMSITIVPLSYSDQVTSNSSEAQMDDQENFMVQERDSLISQMNKQLDDINYMAKDVHIDIKRGTIKLVDVAKAERQCIAIQTECSTLKLSLDVTQKNITKAELYEISLHIQNLSKYFITCVGHDFKNGEFAKKTAQRNVPATLDTSAFINLYSNIEDDIKKVSDRLPYLGINIFHRSYRKLESINEHYHLTDAALATVAISALVAYVIWRMPCPTLMDGDVTVGKSTPNGFEIDPITGNSNDITLDGMPASAFKGLALPGYQDKFTHPDTGKILPSMIEKLNRFSDDGKTPIKKQLEEIKANYYAMIPEESQKYIKYKNFSPSDYTDDEWEFLNFLQHYTPSQIENALLNTGWWQSFKRNYTKLKLWIGHPLTRNADTSIKSGQRFYSPISYLDALGPIMGLRAPDVLAASGALGLYKKYSNTIKQKYRDKKRKVHEFCYGGPIKRKNSDARIIDGSLDDIIGCERAKQEMEQVIRFMEDPATFTRKNIVPPKGILLVGKTRTGKTNLAEKTAGEISRRRRAKGLSEIQFIPVDHKMLQEFSLKEIISTFRRWYGSCILFIDELHNYRLTVEGDVQTLTDFLTTMSGFQEEGNDKDPVIIIAATNNPEKIDPALLQTGRFGKHIICDYPSKYERAIAIERAFNKYNLSLDNNDFLSFAQELLISTEGRSFEDIIKVFENALQQSIVSGKALSIDHFDNAMNEEIYHIEPLTKVPSHKEKSFLSTQLAGTALATHIFQPEKIITRATVCPVKQPIEEKNWYEKNLQQEYTGNGGVFSFNQEDTLSISSKHDLLAECKTLLAPHIAEEVLYGTRSTFNSENNQQAVELLEKHILQGVKTDNLSKKRKEQLLDEVFELKIACEKEVREALEERKDLLEQLSVSLIQHSILGQAELTHLVLTKEEKEKLLADIREMMKQTSQKTTDPVEETD